MASDSSGVRFHEAVQGARHVVERIREDGLMNDTDFQRGFYQRTTRSARSEADKLEKYLDIIVQARFDDIPKSSAPVDPDAEPGKEIPF